MTYESLLHDLEQVYMYFLAFLVRFLEKIKEYPLIMLSLFVLVALPVLYFIFSFIASASASTDDFTTDGIRLYKYFRSDKFKKKAKEMRKNFHKTKRYFEQKKLNNTIKKMEDVPLKIPERYQYLYNPAPAPKKANPSSASTQRSSANIDVEYDED